MSGTGRPAASTAETTGKSGRPTSSIRGGAGATRRRRPLDRTTSIASARVSTPTTSSPAISRASSTAAVATTTRRRPRRASTATMGSTPGTARTSAPSESSPINAARPGPARTCSEPSRIPTAIARSSDAPAFRRSAGARLTVIRRGGWTNPAFRSAPRTRSRASWRAASARPTIVNPGSPGATSTSTRISRPSSPWSVADGTMANTRAAYGRTLTRQSTVAHPSLIRRVLRCAAWFPKLPRSGAQLPSGSDGHDLGGRLVDALRELHEGRPERRIRLREHERRARIESADRAPVLIHHLVLDDPPQGTLRILHADPRECVRTVQDELDLVRVTEVAHGLEDHSNVLEARQVGRHHDEDHFGRLEHPEVDVIESLVDIDQDVVVDGRKLFQDLRQVCGVDDIGALRRRRREEEVDPGVVPDEDL